VTQITTVESIPSRAEYARLCRAAWHIVEQAHQETAAQLKEALAWWEAFEADPEQQRLLEEYAQRRKEPA